MRRNYIWIFSVVIIAHGIFHMGALLKGESSQQTITKTQTDPISHKAKLEEIKEGPKGAPSPTFKYYGDKKVLSELPMEGLEKESDEYTWQPAIPDYGDPIPEDLSGLEEEEELGDEDWWFDEWEDEDLGASDETDEFGI